MLTFWTIFVILLTLSAHEMGHAWAMQEKGVGIKRISLIGVPWPNITLRLPIKWARFPGVEWVIHPMILGAYVEPKEGELEKVTPRDSVYIYSMGPIASLLAGVILIGLSRTGALFDRSGMTSQFITESFSVIGVVGVMWYFRAWIARFVCPIATVGILILVVVTMYYMGVFQSMAGPVGIVDLITQHSSNISETKGNVDVSGVDYYSLWRIMFFAGLISIVIGLSNLLPFMPLDGGQIIKHHLPKSWLGWYPRVSMTLLIFLIIIAFTSDYLRLVSG